MSCFSAQSMLEKHGWTTGSGLGKDESGIKKAIKVSVKNDTKGVGHDPGEQFTFHWWDHAFNKAANNINVKVNDDGVSVTQSGDFNISAKKQQAKTLASKDMLYGRFIKAATLNGNDMVSETPDMSEDSDESDYDKASADKFTDNELFEKCGGLTAHKGARHGLKLSGKLQRIMEQEAKLTPSVTPSSSPRRQDEETNDGLNTENVKKSKKKRKKDKSLVDKSLVDDTGSKESSDSGIVNNEERKEKKKKLKSSKTVCDNNIEDKHCDESLEAGEDLTVVSSSKKKKKKSKRSKKDDEKDVPGHVHPDVTVEKCRKEKKKKSKKNKSDGLDIITRGEIGDSKDSEVEVTQDGAELQRKTKKSKKNKNKEKAIDNDEHVDGLLSRKRKLDESMKGEDSSVECKKKSKKKSI